MSDKREITPAPKPEKTSHLLVLSNGAVYDRRVGHIVDAKNVTTKITPERSIELSRKRQEKKRAAVIQAANRVAEQGGSVDGSEMRGDLAFVEAITESMTMKALSVTDAKAVDAARWVFQEAGVSEAQQQEEQETGFAQTVATKLLAFVMDKTGLLSERDISASNNDADSRVLDVPATDEEDE